MIALAAALGLFSAVPLRSPARDTVPEAVVLELRLGRFVARTIEGYRVGDDALIPLSQFFDMAGIRATISPAGRVDGVLEPGSQPLVIALDVDVATLGPRRVSVTRNRKLLVNGELYFPAAALGELLDAPMYVDWSDLEVVMRDAGPLPVAQQARRRAARAALMLQPGSAAAGPSLPSDRRPWDGFVLDYSFLAPSSDPLGGGSYAVQGGADVLGGSLELGASSLGRADAGQVRVDASWLGVWRDNTALKQLRLGDGFATGPRPRSMRGVSITNAPFVRPSLLGLQPYAGRLPPGWEIEAYRGGELLAFDSAGASGDYAVQLPVLYGENPVQFIAYGPFGERRVFGRTYRVSSALLPAHRFEYAASGGECRFVACRATANLDLRYGLSRQWTLEAGADRFWRDSLEDLFHPYGTITGSLTNALTAQVEGVSHGFLRSGLAYEPSLDTRLTAEYTRFDTRTTAPLITLPGRRALWQFSAFYRPVPDRDFFYFEGAAERAVTIGVTVDRARLGLSLQAGPLRLVPYGRLERESSPGGAALTRGFLGLGGTLLPRQSWGRILGQVFMRGALETQGTSAVTLAALTAARPLTPQVRLEVGVNWTRGFPGPAFTLTLSSYTRSFRSFTTASAQAGAPTELSQLVQGSVLYDRSRRALQLAPGPSLQRAGLAGHVFLDANGNGRRDAGEEGLANVRVQAGNSTATTGPTGQYRLWDVVPFEPVLLAADSLSFDSPLWVAARPAVTVAPGPNRYTVVDIPIVLGSVVEGRVVRRFGDGVQGVAGATLTLRDQAGLERSVATFSDGSFYLLGVRPGEYTLSVDARVLDVLRMQVEPRRFSVTSSGEGPESIDLLLTPRP
ncbi:MAG: hypothetical protein ACM3OH_00920 [Bacillota bacterium]